MCIFDTVVPLCHVWHTAGFKVKSLIISNFAMCSSRTKQRKLAAAVDEFRQQLDSAVNQNAGDDLPTPSHVAHNDLECTSGLNCNPTVSDINFDSDSENEAGIDLGWSLANDHAFEEAIDASFINVEYESENSDRK